MVGAVQFDQLDPVLWPQDRPRQRRRTRIDAQLARRVRGPHEVEIGPQQLGHLAAGSQDPLDPAPELTGLLRHSRGKIVAAGPGMGVQEVDGLGLQDGVAQRMHQHRVLEHVGEAAGMEGVAVAEHDPRRR